jgi:DNA modification methylase
MSVELICGKFEDVPFGLGGKVGLIIADPPDHIGRKYDGVHDDADRGAAVYHAFLASWLHLIREYNCPAFFIFNERWISEVEAVIRKLHIKIVQRCWWYWTFGQNNTSRYTPCMRPIYWLNNDTIYPDQIRVPSKRQVLYKDKRANPKGRLPDTFWGHGDDYGMLSVWNESRVCGTYRERIRWHDNQVNREIYRRIIRGHSKPGDTVLDPFIGSGTCAYVCEEEGRNCIGIDVSQNYLDRIREELDKRESA